jgi:hypothetical protein
MSLYIDIQWAGAFSSNNKGSSDGLQKHKIAISFKTDITI